jgi:hypothetical protein
MAPTHSCAGDTNYCSMYNNAQVPKLRQLGDTYKQDTLTHTQAAQNATPQRAMTTVHSAQCCSTDQLGPLYSST